MKIRTVTLLLPLVLVGISGCDNPQATIASTDKQPIAPRATSSIERWYSQEQVMRGNVLFQENCASCHKPDASGTPNWSELDAQGKLPPPPLNGTAHAWHHPLPILRRTIKMGGVPLGGSMPGFADKLNEKQIDDVLAWVQSHWSDEIYGVWDERNKQANNGLKRKLGLSIQ